MLRVPHRIAEGDCVILYENYQSSSAIKCKRGDVFHTRLGAFRHDDMIGLQFGSRVWSMRAQSSTRAPTWLIALAPTPALWSHSLKHRTQILYPTDIALVLSELALRPGAVVLESGTGSGSLSTALARTVAPEGHLHTFEFNSQRVIEARADFELLGFGPSLLTVYWRDICANGFPAVGAGGEVDAIFLDLPTPSTPNLLTSLCANLRPRVGRVCSFSPCIEQVQKMCIALAQNGFQELKTVECLLRAYDVHDDAPQIPDLGFDDDAVVAAAAAAAASKPAAAVSVGAKRKQADAELDAAAPTSAPDASAAAAEQQPSSSSSSAPASSTSSSAASVSEPAKPLVRTSGIQPKVFVGTAPSKVVTVPVQLARGHTGFLTFATYFGLPAENASAAQAGVAESQASASSSSSSSSS